MAFDLDNEELRATRKLHGLNDDLYKNEKEQMSIGEIIDNIIENPTFFISQLSKMCNECKKENENLEIKLKNKQAEINYLRGQLSVYERNLPKQDKKLHGLDKGVNDKNFAKIEERLINLINDFRENELKVFDIITEEGKYNLADDVEHILTEREQDKNRIKELEKKLEKANKQLDLDYVDDNYITKEKVKELEEESKKVLDLIFEYGQIDGGHHKMWVIDQIVRILTKDKYNEWIKNYVYDEETGDTYSWDKGIAP